MDSVKEYLLSVTVAAVFSACVCMFFQKGSSGKLIRTICSLFVSLTILRPLVHIRFPELDDYIESFSVDANYTVEEGSALAGEAQSRVITQQTEAYISDKASRLSCNLEVSVSLSEESPYQPVGVKLKGDASPYAKSQLTDYIENELGIPREAQQWIGPN